MIPTIITQALSKDRVHLGVMHPTRDFTYIEDTVEGFIKIAESLRSVGEVINIGSGKEISIGDLADKTVSLIDRDVRIVFDTVRFRPEKSEVNSTNDALANGE